MGASPAAPVPPVLPGSPASPVSFGAPGVVLATYRVPFPWVSLLISACAVVLLVAGYGAPRWGTNMMRVGVVLSVWGFWNLVGSLFRRLTSRYEVTTRGIDARGWIPKKKRIARSNEERFVLVDDLADVRARCAGESSLVVRTGERWTPGPSEVDGREFPPEYEDDWRWQLSALLSRRPSILRRLDSLTELRDLYPGAPPARLLATLVAVIDARAR